MRNEKLPHCAIMKWKNNNSYLNGNARINICMDPFRCSKSTGALAIFLSFENNQ